MQNSHGEFPHLRNFSGKHIDMQVKNDFIFYFLNQLNKVTLCFRLNYKLHFLTLGIFSIQYINLLTIYARNARGLSV